MVAPAVRAALAAADDFVGLAANVCAALDELFDVPRTAVALHRAGGGPLLLVDNLGVEQDAYRIATVHPTRYRGGALELALCGELVDPTQFDELGFAGELGHMLVLPLHGRSGSQLIGSIHCCRGAPFALALRCELAMFATLVSARLAQLGVAAGATVPLAHGVTRRGAVAITRG